MNELSQRFKSIELIIFDIDGVLVNVSMSYRRAIKETVEFFYGKEIDKSEVQALKNETGFNNDWDLTQELLRRKNLFPSRDSIVEQFQSLYWGDNGNGFIQDEEWLLEDGILNTLSNSFKLSIFTGRPREEALFILDKNNVLKYFNPIIAMEDVTHGKPHPEGILNISKALSIDPIKICYLGDTFDDVRSAKRAGALPIGVLAPSVSENVIPTFLSEGVFTVFKDVNEVEKVL